MIVATSMPHDGTVLSAISDLGLEHQIIFNKGEIMILPPGTNKGTGFAAALRDMQQSPRNAVAVGDAENDNAFLSLAECSVAVANALPMLKEHADLTTTHSAGAGVAELIEHLLSNDLADLTASVDRHAIPLGTSQDGEMLAIPPRDTSILIAGSAGSGKSTVLAGLLERIADAGYQYVVIDPEGDHDVLPHGIPIGSELQPPDITDVISLIERSGQNTIVSLLGIELGDRPTYFARLFGALEQTRIRRGRPHWIAIDEAHHVLPAWQSDSSSVLNGQMPSQTIYATVDPAHISQSVLQSVTTLIVTGLDAWATIDTFCAALGEEPPAHGTDVPGRDQALTWIRGQGGKPVLTDIIPTRTMHRRHRRKYDRGDMDIAHAFHFRVQPGSEPLVASNLVQFQHLIAQLDDETWLYHLQRGDFYRWFEEVIKDHELAVEARRGEVFVATASKQSRDIIRKAIQRRYTSPA